MFTGTQQEGALGSKPGLSVVKGHRDTRWAQESAWRRGILTDSVFQVLMKKRGPSEPQAHTVASELLRLRESQQRRLGLADLRSHPSSAISCCETFSKSLALSDPGFLQ